MSGNLQLTPKAIYEMVAELGFRKYFHFGGFQATQELIALLPLAKTKTVLDVGCASGKTACYLASIYGCQVTGVDLLPAMVARARERALREGVEALVDFRVGDVQELPLEADSFDIVMGEFITGLVPDKEKALSEYFRVAKPGATIGLNEGTWIKASPPPEFVDYLKNTVGLQGEILSAQDWQSLLEGNGINNLTIETHRVETLQSPRDDIADLLRSLPKVISTYLSSPKFRKFIKASLSLPDNFLDYFGYGLYVGRVDKATIN